jgi:hypothetical protein
MPMPIPMPFPMPMPMPMQQQNPIVSQLMAMFMNPMMFGGGRRGNDRDRPRRSRSETG